MEFSLREIFKNKDVDKIAKGVMSFSKETSISNMIKKVYSCFEKTDKETIFLSGLMLGKIIQLNDMNVIKSEEKPELRYIG